VLAAIDAIRAAKPEARLNRLLIVGPELELAPRIEVFVICRSRAFSRTFCWMVCSAERWPTRTK
jgi:hypothetical protein